MITPSSRWRVDESARADCAGDFGGVTRQRPSVVARVASEAEVASAIGYARQHRLSVCARGAGHSTRGQALVSNGMVIDTSGLSAVHVDGHTATLGAGARWHDVLEATLASGLMPPTLTDYLGLSVGGTLSVGGVGGQSFRHGLQVDQVDQLVVVTGEGRRLACSANCHADLFQACLAGLGQCALIVSARIRLTRAPEQVQVFRLSCDGLSAFLQNQDRLVDCGYAHYLLGSVIPEGDTWRYEIECVEYLFGGASPRLGSFLSDLGASGRVTAAVELGIWEHASRPEAMVRSMQLAGTWKALHPWMDLFVPSRAAHELITYALAALDPPELRDGHIMTYPLLRRHVRAQQVPLPHGDRSLLFDILPSFRRHELERASRFEARLARIWQHARALGASIYPIGYPIGTPAMTPADWQRHFGANWSALLSAKGEYDPDARLTPGPGIVW